MFFPLHQKVPCYSQVCRMVHPILQEISDTLSMATDSLGLAQQPRTIGTVHILLYLIYFAKYIDYKIQFQLLCVPPLSLFLLFGKIPL
jgi:hypothetical protein